MLQELDTHRMHAYSCACARASVCVAETSNQQIVLMIRLHGSTERNGMDETETEASKLGGTRKLVRTS